jgi:hypothetical protein
MSYFDVTIEYTKATPEDILIASTRSTRDGEAAELYQQIGGEISQRLTRIFLRDQNGRRRSAVAPRNSRRIHTGAIRSFARTLPRR